MKILICALLALFASLPAFAQQPTATLYWDYTATLAEVRNYQHTITMDGAPLPQQSPTCVAAGGATTCSVTLLTPPAGPHTYVVTAQYEGVGKSTSAVIDLARGPAQPSGLRFTVTLTVELKPGQ